MPDVFSHGRIYISLRPEARSQGDIAFSHLEPSTETKFKINSKRTCPCLLITPAKLAKGTITWREQGVREQGQEKQLEKREI